MRFRFVLGLVLLVLGFARPAHATPLFEMIGGFGGQGALQARHAGPSAASAYFNPALLPDAPSGLFAGVLVLNTSIGVRVGTRPAGVDIPVGVTQAYQNGASLPVVPIPTTHLRNGRPDMPELGADANIGPFAPRPRQHAGTGHGTHTYEAVGIVIRLLDGRVGLGVYSMLPNVNFTQFNTYFANELEQFASNSLHPELYGERLKAISVAVSGGFRVTDTLSLGLGVTIGVNAYASALAYTTEAKNLTKIDLNIDADAKISLSPQAGLSWRPAKRWHLTGTLHAPQKVDIKPGFDFLLGTGVSQGASLGFTYDFMPWQAGAGLSYDVLHQDDLIVTATASALYGRWSKYIDRQSIRPSGAYEWNDTISGAAGMRMEKGPLSMALDGQYKPTPVPLQTGRYNYVDNDRLGLALAVDYGFELWKQPMKLGLMLQSYRMIERTQTKLPTPTFADGVNRTPQLVKDEIPDNALNGGGSRARPFEGREGLQTNNPGFPSFSSVGWISSAGLYLTMML